MSAQEDPSQERQAVYCGKCSERLDTLTRTWHLSMQSGAVRVITRLHQCTKCVPADLSSFGRSVSWFHAWCSDWVAALFDHSRTMEPTTLRMREVASSPSPASISSPGPSDEIVQ